jgi:hypothetical protein
MITTIIQFELSSSFTPQKARAAFAESAAKFLNMAGLIRKYFLLAEDGKSAASVYLWESRVQAEAFFTDSWKDFIAEKYGYRPTVTYYECSVVVDNLSGEIITVP